MAIVHIVMFAFEPLATAEEISGVSRAPRNPVLPGSRRLS